MNAGDLDKAERFLRQSIEYDENFSESLLAMGTLSYERGQYMSARAFLQRYEATALHTEESLYEMYRVEKELGDEHAAAEYRRRLIQEFPNSNSAKSLARE